MAYDINDITLRDPKSVLWMHRVITRFFYPWHRPKVTGLERIPPGAALYVGNHNGGLLSIDTFLWCAKLIDTRGLADLPYGLAHSPVLKIPVFNTFLIPLGAVAATEDNARRLFEAGHKVLVYPGGDVESLRPWRQRDVIKFDGRRGYVRTALRHGVPIVPVVTQGAQSAQIIVHDFPAVAKALRLPGLLRVKRWPLTLSLPWGVTFGPSPPYIPLPVKIRTSFLAPVWFERQGGEAAADEAYVARCAAQVEGVMQAELTRLAAL